MPNILIVYHSRTGNTRKMAEIIAQAAQEAGGTVTVRAVAEAKPEEMLTADAVVLGSPTYYGHSAGAMRSFIDASVKFHGRLAGKVGAAFASSHNVGGGNETTVLDLLHALLIHGMVVQGNAGGDHYGPVSIGMTGRARDRAVPRTGRQRGRAGAPAGAVMAFRRLPRRPQQRAVPGPRFPTLPRRCRSGL